MENQKDLIEILEEQTKLTLPDIDNIAKYELLLLGKTQEIESLEAQISQAKDNEYLLVEREFDRLSKDKNSEEYKALSNGEKRAIQVKENLAANKNYTELVQKCSKLKTEARVMRLAIDSLKRQHDREIRGLAI